MHLLLQVWFSRGACCCEVAVDHAARLLAGWVVQLGMQPLIQMRRLVGGQTNRRFEACSVFSCAWPLVIQPTACPPLPLCCPQLLAAIDLNDPVVKATMLAMLPLPEDEPDADKENAGGQPLGLAAALGQRGGAAGGGEADWSLEDAIWPVGQVRWG